MYLWPVTENRLADANDCLGRYYGIHPQFTACPPGEDCPMFELPFDPEMLERTYSALLGICGNDVLITDTLTLLSFFVLENAPVLEKESYARMIRKYVRQDMLRLMVFCNDNIGPEPGPLTLRGKRGSVLIENACNWFGELLQRYLDENLPEITDVEHARSELVTGRSGRGRRPNDARVPALLWGTFRMLTDLHGFNTPMPNVLCDFLIKLLQFQNIFPEESDIDVLWIRAELRYLRSRPSEPRYPGV